MARLFTAGFDTLGSPSLNEWGANTGSPAAVATNRTGGHSLEITGLVSATRKGVLQQFTATAGLGPYYLRAYFRFAVFPTAENTIMMFTDGTSATTATNRYRVTVNATGVLRIYNAATLVGTSTLALATGLWYRLEMKVDGTATGTANQLELRVNGVLATGASSQTLGFNVWGFQIGGNINAETQTTGDWFIDDVALNDNTGTYQNAYPGEGKVLTLIPNGVGDNTGWTREGTDLGSNYLQVSDNGSDATNYIGTSLIDTVDDYAMSDSGLGASDIVNLVHVNYRFRRSATTATNTTFAARLKSASGGTVIEGPSVNATSTAFRTNGGSNAALTAPQLTSYTNPSGTGSWTASLLDSMQTGLRATATGSASEANVTSIWATVDYTPAPVLVQTVQGNGGGYVNSYTKTITPTLGNTLIISLAYGAGDSMSVSDNKGNVWTLTATSALAGQRQVRMFRADGVAAGATTLTFQAGAGAFIDSAVIIQEWQGLAPSAPLDKTAVYAGNASSYAVGPTPATTQGTELVLGVLAADASAPGMTGAAGYQTMITQAGFDAYTSISLQYKIVTTTGAQSWNPTSSTPHNAAAVLATFATSPVAVPTYTSPTTGVPGASAQANWYTYGYAPNVALATRQTYMQNAWNQWVSYTVTNTGMPAGMPAGAYRVKVPDQNDPNTGLPNGTFSEGIGYGMLAAVWMGNPANPKYDPLAKTYFDGFWKYYNFFKDANGLMNWRIDHLGNVTGTGGATDGDTDVALALVLASRLWGNAGTFNYGALATTLITAIGNFEFYSATHTNTAIRNTIINGDSWDASFSGSPDWVMPDYFAPAWYREFYNHTGDTRWLDIITAGYNQLIQPYDTAYNTGFVPDNATRAGLQQGTNSYKFAYNSIRYPWRMASDYLWNGTNTNALAYYFPKKLASFTNTQATGVASVAKAEWAIDGSANGGYINAAFTQAYAAATLVDSTTSTWGASLMAYSDTNNTAAYFGNSLVLMTAILASGQAATTFAAPAAPVNTGTMFFFM